MHEDVDEGTTLEEQYGDGDRDKLMESGSVRPDGDGADGADGCGDCHVRRGMPAISADGEEVGRVAAVVLDAAGRSTGLVMARWQTTLEYCHLPVGVISQVREGRVVLAISAEVARTLPPRHPGPTP